MRAPTRRRDMAVPYAVAFLAVAVSIFPIFWILTIALKTRVDAFAMPPVWFFSPVWENFGKAWSSTGFSRAFYNSLIVCAIGNVIALAAGIPAAYFLNRRHAPGRKTVLIWLLISYMLPEFLFIIPTYVLFQYVGLYDTVIGLALIYQIFTLPFTIWLLRAFFADIPEALGEAARLEGASTWQIIWKIYVPIAAPGIAATVILNSIKMWNELTIALALTFEKAQTVTLAVAGFRGYASIDWGAMSAASIIIILPMALFAILAQRRIVQGLSLGAVK
ncbi:carbohydrate ABC transporter permease [Mesorhizobium sp. VK23B]|uniref:Carbohydrate ABC transporter permease n=1 Tax=Mesorhizobium dulcispinae TaxID=3072316 RepID=A0ABU4XD10_9HYPH|nr:MULTISPECIES: carbohydrate ABC transporter permease [unclassified Mesorhizobium]MDX8465696.1 carbohydrate ABC transporter permease [Mesorhizobium sp. VK23B]MDX8471502.1 carbohydrate ABC transporter permease [Mesorhizobium sp. VK23A]